jgi:hypothetical protein
MPDNGSSPASASSPTPDRAGRSSTAENRYHGRNSCPGVLGALRVEQLLEPSLIQGYDTTVLGAVYHVVEHFAMHTGQIILLTKARTGRDLGFYRVKDGIAKPTWLERS